MSHKDQLETAEAIAREAILDSFAAGKITKKQAGMSIDDLQESFRRLIKAIKWHVG